MAARWARREERVSGVVSRSRDAAAVDAAEAELAASTTSRMAQSDAPHAPAPWLRSRDNADDGAAGSCTRAADVALRQLSRLFSCSHDDDTGAADADGAPRDGVVGAAAAFLGRWPVVVLAATTCLVLFLDDAAMARWLPLPAGGGVLGVGESGGGGGFFLRLVWLWWWWWRRRSEVSVAVTVLEEEEEEGRRRVESAMGGEGRLAW